MIVRLKDDGAEGPVILIQNREEVFSFPASLPHPVEEARQLAQVLGCPFDQDLEAALQLLSQKIQQALGDIRWDSLQSPEDDCDSWISLHLEHPYNPQLEQRVFAIADQMEEAYPQLGFTMIPHYRESQEP